MDGRGPNYRPIFGLAEQPLCDSSTQPAGGAESGGAHPAALAFLNEDALVGAALTAMVVSPLEAP
jgi:hypothetical protein